MTDRAAYMRRYRATRAEDTERLARQRSARSRALERLSRRHPAEFGELYRSERTAAGVEPPAMERPCACGGTIRRAGPSGRWPVRCERCRR